MVENTADSWHREIPCPSLIALVECMLVCAQCAVHLSNLSWIYQTHHDYVYL